MPTKHTLLNSGGQGCVFSPAIHCRAKKTHAKKKKKRKNKKKRTRGLAKKSNTPTISKVMFKSKSAEREITMDDIVRDIEGHEEWCVLWDTMCETPSYKTLKQISEIDSCLSAKHMKPESDKTFPMLVGPRGGVTYYDYGLSLFKPTGRKSVFDSQTSFDTCLLKMTRLLQGVCLGISVLHSAKIVHGDISVRNVLIQEDRSYLIDFGLSYRVSNQSYVKSHLEYILKGTDKIYDAFPYEYCLYYGTYEKSKIKEELEDMERGIMREHHEDHVHYHETILGRKPGSVDRTLKTYLQHTNKTRSHPELSDIVRSLDTYSVGILLPTMLHDVSQEYKISMGKLHALCNHTKHPEIFELFRDMTEFYSKDRISPRVAYERLCKI
jgi:serine/threonine protein kinase